jgi:8-oxo-dGTP pyrophosphatase MutT (NUDIX family)
MLMQQSANLRDYAGEVSLVSPYRFIKAAVEVSLILSLWRSLVYYALVMCRAWLQDECGVVRVILTQRSANLRNHAGEVALPGGKADPEDADSVATALREAYEEVRPAAS